MTIWHVIRLAPGALKSHKIWRNQSIVERSLYEGGFAYFMPFEHKSIIHHRTKKRITTRQPLIIGYGFVEGVTNFEALRQCDGVSDVIKSAGRPVPIPAFEVHKVMASEAAINAEFDRKEAARKAREAMGSRALVAEAFPVNSVVRIRDGHLLAGQEFIVNAATGRATIKGVIDALNGMSVEIDAVHLEAAE